MADKTTQERYFNTPMGWVRAPAGATDKEIMEDLMDLGSSPEDAQKTIANPHTQAGMVASRVGQSASNLGKQVIGGLGDTIGGAVDVFRPTKIGPEPLENKQWSPTDTSADISKLFGVSPPQSPAENIVRQGAGTALGGLAVKGPAAVKAFYGIAPGVLGYLGGEASGAAGSALSDSGLVSPEFGAKIGPAGQMISTLFGPQYLGKRITPNPTSPERLKAAKTVRGAGMDVTAGNVTGNPQVLGAEAVADPSIAQRQHRQFGEYLAKQAGAQGSMFDTGPGGFFDTQGKRIYSPTFANTQPYFKDLEGIQKRSLAENRSKLLDVVRGAVGFEPSPKATPGSELTSALARGMDSRQYYSLRSALANDASVSRETNPRYAAMVDDVVGAIDRSMGQQNPQATGSPSWATQEEQYRILRKAREQGAGPEPDPGQIKRAEQSVSGFPRMLDQTSPNAGMLEALDKMTKAPDDAAKNFWSHSNQSGLAKGTLGGIGSAITAALMHHEPFTPGIFGAMVTGGIPKIGDYAKSKVAMNPLMQGYWENQALPTGPGYLDKNWATLQALMMKGPFPDQQSQSQPQPGQQ